MRIASRGSRLALWQAEWVRTRLAAAWPDRFFEIVRIETTGDRVLDRPLPEIGGKGLFTEALEEALLAGDVDAAVHSLKDLPTDPPAGLKVGAVCEREDARDAWVSTERGPRDPRSAAPGARVGTSSERRRAQLLALRPDLRVESIRGNVETRIRKLDEGGYDALIMAAAGLIRLGLAERITSLLDAPDWLPAPGQGAVAVESRADDAATDRLLRCIDDPAARAETEAERALLHRLQGGCQVPVGARARLEGNELVLQALVASRDGREAVRAEGRGEAAQAERLGIEVAESLLDRGGEAIVARFRGPAA
ncbi:MAG: hydroxymethylbilane synthase [Gemmatimonadota bacterium]|nr:MAG: hydroxymethylbilane synthase [Gemmatimonadota bacterium]